MNASKHGTNESSQKFASSAFIVHSLSYSPLCCSSILVLYGSYSKSIEYQWRCCWPAVRMMNSSKHGTNAHLGWLGAAKILCQVCSSYSTWPTHLFASPVYYYYSSNLLNINGDAAGRLFEWWTPPSIIRVCQKFVPSSFVVHSLRYNSAMAAIANQLNINGDAAGWSFERWTPPSIVPMNFQSGVELTETVSSAFVIHSLSYTPFYCSSILVLWQL